MNTFNKILKDVEKNLNDESMYPDSLISEYIEKAQKDIVKRMNEQLFLTQVYGLPKSPVWYKQVWNRITKGVWDVREWLGKAIAGDRWYDGLDY